MQEKNRRGIIPLLLFIFSLLFIGKGFSQEFISGSTLNKSQMEEVVDFHNQARAEVGVEPLVWSAELSVHAQEWAEYLAKSNGCRMKHRPERGKWKAVYGENIYWGKGYSLEESPLLASVLWYEEKKDFKNNLIKPSRGPQTGHYSQMVWRTTKEVGMGMAICRNGDVIVVANYNPPGNYIGERAY